MSMRNLIDCVTDALSAAGFDKPCCAVLPDDIKERRLPMGRLERQSRIVVKYHPEPAERVLGFFAQEDKPADYRVAELLDALELVLTPDGPVRGRKLECSVKDGAAVAGAVYTELLRETAARETQMGRIEMTITPPPNAGDERS
jgi:hypothetical protein